VPVIVAWLVRLNAVLTVLDIMRPGVASRLARTEHSALLDGATVALAIASAGAQVVLANGLRQRKRRSWQMSLVLVAISSVATYRHGSMVATTAGLLVLILLVLARHHFTATPGPGTLRHAAQAFVVMLGISIAAGLALTEDTAPSAHWLPWLGQTLAGLVGFVPDLPFTRPPFSDFASTALPLMGAATALVTTAVLLAPSTRPPRPTPDDDADARLLLERWGEQDSLGYFALRSDKSLVFSPTRKAAVAYGLAGAVALASGDPIGDPEAWPGAIRAWLAISEANGWIPGVLGAGEAAATAYARAGLEVLELGDEAVLDLSEFSLEGRAMRTVRQAVHRVGRAGHTMEVDRQKNLTPAQIAELRAAATAMRDGEVERGFSMALGRIGEACDPELVVVRAREADGRLVAVLVFAPWGTRGLSLDVMRRVSDADNGVVEFMIAGLVAQAPELGIDRISLNFSAFRSTFERGSRIGAGPILRLWRQVLLFASRWWQIESLYRANAKYRPIWVTRFICYRRAAELPRIGIAALEAEALVARPRIARLLRPRLGASSR
jgi:lysyl-tRNA synthetase, class II